MTKYLPIIALLLAGCAGGPSSQPSGDNAATSGEAPGKFSIITEDGRVWPPRRNDR